MDHDPMNVCNMDIGMIVRERDCIADIFYRDTTMSMMTTTSMIEDNNMKGRNSEPAIELASPRTRRSQRNTRVDTSCPRPEHQQHAAWPDHDRHKDEEPAIEHRRGRADYGATEWIDMRQSSTVRASNTCSTARQTVTTRLNLQPRTTLEATTSEQPDSAGGDDTLNDNDIDDRDHRRHLEQQREWQLYRKRHRPERPQNWIWLWTIPWLWFWNCEIM